MQALLPVMCCGSSVRMPVDACLCLICCRESEVNQLRSEVHEVLGNRNMTDEKFQAVVLDEIAGIKVSSTCTAQSLVSAHLTWRW